MNNIPFLTPGDTVELIAPAARCKPNQLDALAKLLTSWKLNCIIQPDIFGDDLLCANSDEKRFKLLLNAVTDSNSKAIICARGGYGCIRLLPSLAKIKKPSQTKLFVGMSDITALNIFLNQSWQWPVIHGALSPDIFSENSLLKMKSVLLHEIKQITYEGHALNALAEKEQTLSALITGGNLAIIQAGIGTLWQIDTHNKILFLEDVGERGYRIDRMLQHLEQAKILQNALAIIFGDFTEGKEPDGKSFVMPVIERFAKNCKVPVIKIDGIGHGYENAPLPLGIMTKLKLGNKIQLSCELTGNDGL